MVNDLHTKVVSSFEGFKDLEDKPAFLLAECKAHLPALLETLVKAIGPNFEKTGFAAGKAFSAADVAVMTFLGNWSFHAMRKDGLKEVIEKFPLLTKYWEARKGDFGDYYDTRKPKLL